MTKNHSDYLWLASAKEGLACTMLLMSFLQADVGVSVHNLKVWDMYSFFLLAYYIQK